MALLELTSQFGSFHNAVLEDQALQKQAISIVNTTTANPFIPAF